jgi:hypothetical protein
MAEAARKLSGLIAASDHVGHRRMVVGVPVRRTEEIADLRHRVGGFAVGNVFQCAVVFGRLESWRIDWIGPHRPRVICPRKQLRTDSQINGRKNEEAIPHEFSPDYFVGDFMSLRPALQPSTFAGFLATPGMVTRTYHSYFATLL